MKKTYSLGVSIILSAIIWGAVLLLVSSALKGTECYEEIKNILAGGAGIHLILVWGPLGSTIVLEKKQKAGKDS